MGEARTNPLRLVSKTNQAAFTAIRQLIYCKFATNGDYEQVKWVAVI